MEIMNGALFGCWKFEILQVETYNNMLCVAASNINWFKFEPTVKKHQQPKYIGGGMMISSNEIRHCNIHPSARQCLEPVSCQISGFWMGPDVEDGWGFIQASVLILSSSNLT